MPEPVKNSQNLSKNQSMAIPLILQGKDISEGCKRAKITRQTFYLWLKNPEFKTEFIKQRQEIIDLALSELKTSTGEAVEVLRNLLKAEGESIRLRTAQAIIENVLKSIEIEDLERRIEELERRIVKQEI